MEYVTRSVILVPAASPPDTSEPGAEPDIKLVCRGCPMTGMCSANLHCAGCQRSAPLGLSVSAAKNVRAPCQSPSAPSTRRQTHIRRAQQQAWMYPAQAPRRHLAGPVPRTHGQSHKQTAGASTTHLHIVVNMARDYPPGELDVPVDVHVCHTHILEVRGRRWVTAFHARGRHCALGLHVPAAQRLLVETAKLMIRCISHFIPRHLHRNWQPRSDRQLRAGARGTVVP